MPPGPLVIMFEYIDLLPVAVPPIVAPETSEREPLKIATLALKLMLSMPVRVPILFVAIEKPLGPKTIESSIAADGGAPFGSQLSS